METLTYPTNHPASFDPIEFSEKCSLNFSTTTPNSEENHQFLPEYSGVYYHSKGDRRSGKLTDHYILFENDTLFVDGEDRGNVSNPANQSFLERLRNFEVPDEFPEDGTHQIFVDKKGKELARFDAEYFEEMREVNVLGSGDEYDDYDINDSDDEDVW